MLEASGISIHMQSVAQASRQQLSEAIQQAIQALQIFVSWKGCRVYYIRPCCQQGRAFPCGSERAGSLAGSRQRVGGLRNACADRRGAQGGAGSCRRSERDHRQTARTASQPRTETRGDRREYENTGGTVCAENWRGNDR
jgi:hypothetical protein